MSDDDKKRMDMMEKDMLDLKSKLSSLEESVNKNNEEISNKFNAMELQQQTANTDIKTMFAQLMSEIGTIKSTVAMSTSAAAVSTEQERKKPRVD